MYNKYINKLTPNSKILITIFLSISLYITNSVYLILFISVLNIYLIILSEKSVKEYIKIFKNYVLILLFFIIIYIIIISSSLASIITFTYKTIIFEFLIINYFSNINFSELHSTIYSCLKILEKFNLEVEKISFNISIYLYYINTLFTSGEIIKRKQMLFGNKKHGLKSSIMPRILYSNDQTNKFENNLKLYYYKLEHQKSNLTSLFSVVVVVIILIISIFKEVI